MTLAVARFCRWYGTATYFGWNSLAAPTHHTRDGIVPWTVFLVLYARLAALLALERLNAVNAHATAIAVTHTEDRGRASRMLDELSRDAQPAR